MPPLDDSQDSELVWAVWDCGLHPSRQLSVLQSWPCHVMLDNAPHSWVTVWLLSTARASEGSRMSQITSILWMWFMSKGQSSLFNDEQRDSITSIRRKSSKSSLKSLSRMKKNFDKLDPGNTFKNFFPIKIFTWISFQVKKTFQLPEDFIYATFN